jgi:hypothetical protein
MSQEKLHQLFGGNVPSSDIVLVLSRINLEAMGLLDAKRKVDVHVNDRVEKLMKNGATVHPFSGDGLYVFEVRSASWGFGPEGHDLELIFLNDRQKGV